MARKKKSFDYNATFPTRLRLLIDERNDVTQDKIAEMLGVTRQTVGNWCNGDSAPDAVSLTKMAEYFDVSIDWLLNKAAPKKIDAKLAAVCGFTGLTEDAARKLHYYREVEKRNNGEFTDITGILSAFITTDTLLSFADHLHESMQTRKSAIETLEDALTKNSDDTSYISYNLQIGTWQDNQLYRLERFEAIDAATNFVNGQLEHYNKKYADLYEKCMAIISGGEINGEHKERNE